MSTFSMLTFQGSYEKKNQQKNGYVNFYIKLFGFRVREWLNLSFKIPNQN